MDIFEIIDSIGQSLWKEDLNTLQADYSLKEKNLNALQENHNKIKNLISEMNKTFKQTEKLFNSNKF